MDEQYGRDVAAAGGIPTTGTAALVIDAVRSGDIPAASRRETLDELVEAGWYCSPPLYARIRRRLEDCGPHTEGKPNAYPDEARPSQPSFALVGVTDRWVGRELDEGSSGSYRTLSPGGSRSARWHCPAVRTDPTSLACGSGSARRSARTTAGTSP